MLASATVSSAAVYPGAIRPVAKSPVTKSAELPEDAESSLAWNASGCLRGLRYGIAIELTAAAMVYGVWRLVHLL